MKCKIFSVATFWTNPQYRVKIVDPDSDDDDGNGTLIVGLMQKERRKLKKEGKQNLSIGYAVYKVRIRLDKVMSLNFLNIFSPNAMFTF